MDVARRKALRNGAGFTMLALAAAGGLLRPGAARAEWNTKAFDTRSLAETVKALGGGAPIPSRDIILDTPDIAENGAIVPFTITSKLPGTEQVALLIEKNPSMLAASFAIPRGTDPWVNTRARMGQTSNVIALVKADGKFYYTATEVKVTLGGCGG